MPASSVDVIIIGGGHNGLVAGCYLAPQLETLILEALPTVGGMSSSGRPFPEAPDHIVQPCALDLFVIRSSTILEDLGVAEFGFRQLEVDPPYVHLDPDGASIAIWRDARRTADEIARISRRDAAAYLQLHTALDAAVMVTAPFMGGNPMRPSPRLLAQSAASAIPRGSRLRAALDVIRTPPAQILAERFEHPIVRAALGSVTAQVGSLTSAGTGAVFLLLPYLQRFGVGRAAGGMQTLVDALARRFAASGGSVRTGVRVEEILVAGGRATGVRLSNGEEIRARRGVVAACDPRVTLGQLVPGDVLPPGTARKVRRLPANADGTGDLKVDLALSGQVSYPRYQKWRNDDLDLRIPVALLGSEADFNRGYALSAAGILSEPIPTYLAIPTSVDPSLAPPGQDTIYLWSGVVPAQPVEPLEDYRVRAAKSMVATAAAYCEGLESLEIARQVDTSSDLAARYNASNGCVLHVDWDLTHIGPLRPAWGLGGYRTPIKHLYLSGAGTHPGAGVAGFAGRNAAREVLRDVKKQKGSA